MSMLDDETIHQLQERLRVYRRNLSHSLAQVAKHGGEAAAPLPTANDIHEARDNIRNIKDQLRSNGISIEDHPDDARPSPRGIPPESETFLGAQWEELSLAGSDELSSVAHPVGELREDNTQRQKRSAGTFPRKKKRIDFSAIPKTFRGMFLLLINSIILSCLAILIMVSLVNINEYAKVSADSRVSRESVAYIVPSLLTYFLLATIPIFCLWVIISMHSRRQRKQQEELQKRLDRLYEMPEILNYIAIYDSQLFSTVWENWLDFLRYLQKRSRRAEDILKHCVPLEIQGETLKVACASNVIIRQINGIAENSPKTSIERALYDFYGKPNKITCVFRDDEEIVHIKAKIYDPSKDTNSGGS